MASEALIIAHDNIFNKAILQKDAFYFNDKFDVKKMLSEIKKNDNLRLIENNNNKILQEFNWNKINDEYLQLFEKCFSRH